MENLNSIEKGTLLEEKKENSNEIIVEKNEDSNEIIVETNEVLGNEHISKGIIILFHTFNSILSLTMY